MLEHLDKIIHLCFDFDAVTLRVRALDASKSQRACIILSKITRKSKYAVINLQQCAATFLAFFFGFLLYNVAYRKTTKTLELLIYFMEEFTNFIGVCVLIFLSLGCNLVMWYKLNKINGAISCSSQYRTVRTGKQHGGCGYVHLQTLHNMTSHETFYFV